MTGPIDDLTLIAECGAGRTDAYGHLVRKYQDRLYPTALRLTGGVEDALDLLQDTFLRGFQKLGSFHGESGFYTWIYRIMVNLALTERRKRTPRLFRGTGGADAIDAPDRSPASDPTAPVERAEREAEVQAALGALAPDHRAVVVMKEFDGLRYEEIAEALGVPVGTVRSRLHRARSELRERLRPPDEGPEPGGEPEPARSDPGDPSAASSLVIGSSSGARGPRRPQP